MSDATGLLGLEAMGDDAAAYAGLVKILAAQNNHAQLVKVIQVNPSGLGPATGTVDVQPMVHQTDGLANTTPHGVISGLCYCRLQGGANAVIIDPVAGDIGLAVFCDRDITNVKQTQAPAAPGSRRRFSWSDGIYIGGLLNGTPVQYAWFMSDRIRMVTPLLEVVGDVHATGAVIAGFGGADQVGLQSHLHNQGNDSHGDSEVPTNTPTAGT